MSTTRKAVDVACPDCGSAPGTPCLTAAQTRVPPHRKRIQLASDTTAADNRRARERAAKEIK